VLIVSHDRYFMDRLVDHLFVFEGNGVVRDFPGNYTQLRIEEREKEKKQVAPIETATKPSTPSSNNTVTIEIKTAKKLSFKEKQEFEQIEKEMPQLEARKTKITEEMSSGNLSFDAMKNLGDELLAITSKLEQMELRWLELAD